MAALAGTIPAGSASLPSTDSCCCCCGQKELMARRYSFRWLIGSCLFLGSIPSPSPALPSTATASPLLRPVCWYIHLLGGRMRGEANGEEEQEQPQPPRGEEEQEEERQQPQPPIGEEEQEQEEERQHGQRTAPRPSSGQQQQQPAAMRSVGYVGKHRLSAAIARLDQDLQSLQDELNEFDTMEPASAACQEVITSTEGKSDPLLPITSGPENSSWDRWFQRVRSSSSNKWWTSKGSDFL